MTYREIIKEILSHDLGPGAFYLKDGVPDRTFNIVAKSDGVLCGMIFLPTIIEVVEREFFIGHNTGELQNVCFRNPLGARRGERGEFAAANIAEGGENKYFAIQTTIKIYKRDGDEVKAGDVLVEFFGNAEVLLKAERTMCNMIARLSGIATNVKNEMEKLKGTDVILLDTRKDISLLRTFDKHAVKVGGGGNHRAGLYDGVMIKDNDIAVYGGIKQAIDKRIGEVKFLTRLEIEVADLEQLKEVLEDSRADVIMLDNMTPPLLRQAVEMIKKSDKKYVVEASGVGGLDLREVAETGVNYISMSSLVSKGEGSPLDVSMRVID